MDNKHSEQWYQELARKYTEIDGEKLRQEMQQLHNTGAYPSTAGLDKKVKKKLRTRRYWKYAAGLGGLAAACLVFFFVLPMLRGIQRLEETNQIEDAEPVAEVIPLSFELAANFSIDNVEQDHGQTIYLLEDTEMDPVVLTLERAELQVDETKLDIMPINGEEVYYIENTDFHLITFEKDGISYSLTCEYDMNTLIALSKNIL